MTEIEPNDECRQIIKAATGLEFTGDQVRDAARFSEQLTRAIDECGLALVPKALLSDEQLKQSMSIRIKSVEAA
jgi:hypothetical protein